MTIQNNLTCEKYIVKLMYVEKTKSGQTNPVPEKIKDPMERRVKKKSKIKARMIERNQQLK